MHIEKIKADLAQRVQKIMVDRTTIRLRNPSIKKRMKTLRDKVKDTEDLVQKVYDTLNEVLLYNDIRFSNTVEYDVLISDLEPTVNDLVLKNMED